MSALEKEPEKVEEKKDEDDSSSSSDSDSEEEEDVESKVDDFLYEMGQEEREAKLGVVEKAFKLNPLEVLDVPTHATVSEVKAQYRKLSLLIHPDKLRPEVRARAQACFSKLAEAKMALLDEIKRRDIVSLVVRARNQLLEQYKQKEKEARKAKVRAKQAHIVIMTEPYPDFASQPGFDNAVKAQMNELLIENAWRQRQMSKQAQTEQKVVAKARKEIDTKTKKKEKAKEEWEKKREDRVSSWRDFQKKGKKKRKRKINVGWGEDSERTFVRRPKKIMG